MHCLEVIVARNERAAAREEAHAFNDGILDKDNDVENDGPYTDNYLRAYWRAREEN